MIPETITTTAPDAIVYLMQNYANYNLWVNVTLINWLRTKPEEVLEQEVPSSFPSIKRTLVHILESQYYWLAVIRKDEKQRRDPFNGTLEDAYKALLDHSAALAAYVKDMTAADIQATTLVESRWFRCNFQHFEYITQIVTHGTYHRGQIITMGRNLGFTDAPMTDYQYYNVYGKQSVAADGGESHTG
ncbi:DinB family protein [Chitinophaga defluvii]|uniref:DinB family protein n=1 Tax=Chitinophaga defluvii TaxID=3163343 RepID=A0ABV2T9Z8_9BACT